MQFDFKKFLSQYSNVGPIFRKELRSYFNSAVAYVVIVVFLAIVGWFFTSSLFLVNIASMRTMFEVIPAVFLFIIPAITMRLLSEEKKSGTIELLTTKPISDTEIVLGKFLAAWALVGLAMLPTILYYITLAFLGNIDSGPVVGGYFGLMLMAGVYCDRVVCVESNRQSSCCIYPRVYIRPGPLYAGQGSVLRARVEHDNRRIPRHRLSSVEYRPRRDRFPGYSLFLFDAGIHAASLRRVAAKKELVGWADTAELWKDGMMERWNNGMVELRNGHFSENVILRK